MKALAADALFSYVFYRSLPVFLAFLPAVLFYPLYIKKDLIPLRKRKLLLQFREGLSVLSGSLSAGYSLENAFAESLRELQLLFGSDALIVREFDQIASLIFITLSKGETSLDNLKNLLDRQAMICDTEKAYSYFADTFNRKLHDIFRNEKNDSVREEKGRKHLVNTIVSAVVHQIYLNVLIGEFMTTDQ